MLSYLTADPARITAVDLSLAHVALNRLKLAAACRLPTWQAFYRFFGAADEPANVEAYDRLIAPHLDAESRAYWEGRSLHQGGRRRISIFARNVYRHGVLGRFIGVGHVAARLYGVDLRAAADRAHARGAAALLRDHAGAAVRQAGGALGDGQPPVALRPRHPAGAVRGAGRRQRHAPRAARAASNGWPATSASTTTTSPGRPSAAATPARRAGPLPPYLRREHFHAVRSRADRVEVLNRSITEYLAGCPDASRDRYVLLDAQDWMTDAQLDALWAEITRTARPGARVIFRTAAEPTLLPGRARSRRCWTAGATRTTQSRALDRARPLGDLWRLPSLCPRRLSMSDGEPRP